MRGAEQLGDAAQGEEAHVDETAAASEFPPQREPGVRRGDGHGHRGEGIGPLPRGHQIPEGLSGRGSGGGVDRRDAGQIRVGAQTEPRFDSLSSHQMEATEGL